MAYYLFRLLIKGISKNFLRPSHLGEGRDEVIKRQFLEIPLIVNQPNILNAMKQGRKTASEKRKEAAKPRNHPRSKPEKISIKRPEPDQEKNPVPDSKDSRLINPNEP